MSRFSRVLTVAGISVAVTATYYVPVVTVWPGGTAGFVLGLAFVLWFPQTLFRAFDPWIDPPPEPDKEE